MDGDVHVEHGYAHGQARASGGTALSGEALGRGSYAAVPNACRSVDSYARDTASTVLRRCPVFWPESEACGESSHHRIDTMTRTTTENGKPKTKEQACSTLAKAKDSLDIHKRRIQAMANVSQAGRRMKMRCDRDRDAAVSYKVGDLVLWSNAATLKAGEGHSHKLVNKFDGPYRVSKHLGNNRYVIEAKKGDKGYKRFKALVAVDSLRRYHGGMM
nr:unnamed protein product [Callosobruchus analis]